MRATNLECFTSDTAELRNLILDNPDLPLMVFCGEEAWTGEYCYEQTQINSVKIQELTLYKNYFVEKDDYKEQLSEDLSDEEGYADLTNEEYNKEIDRIVEETEFIKAIVIYVG